MLVIPSPQCLEEHRKLYILELSLIRQFGSGLQLSRLDIFYSVKSMPFDIANRLLQSDVSLEHYATSRIKLLRFPIFGLTLQSDTCYQYQLDDFLSECDTHL
jgi:hypothetical protein